MKNYIVQIFGCNIVGLFKILTSCYWKCLVAYERQISQCSEKFNELMNVTCATDLLSNILNCFYTRSKCASCAWMELGIWFSSRQRVAPATTARKINIWRQRKPYSYYHPHLLSYVPCFISLNSFFGWMTVCVQHKTTTGPTRTTNLNVQDYDIFRIC
jgi:hypothetical protein